MCQVILDRTLSGAARDGIPSVQLTDADLVWPGSPSLDFLLSSDRVIGLKTDGGYVAVPLNILWWHEIVNLNDQDLAITHCPLTGSSMVFERPGAGSTELGVSGLLFNNNLVMFDRGGVFGVESLWPQMLAGGFCGPKEGEKLTMVAAIEIEWADWLEFHPDTRVVGSETGISRDYRVYPYGNYAFEQNEFTLAPIENLDRRRPPKERLLGIPFADGGGRNRLPLRCPP